MERALVKEGDNTKDDPELPRQKGQEHSFQMTRETEVLQPGFQIFS